MVVDLGDWEDKIFANYINEPLVTRAECLKSLAISSNIKSRLYGTSLQARKA